MRDGEKEFRKTKSVYGHERESPSKREKEGEKERTENQREESGQSSTVGGRVFSFRGSRIFGTN